MIQFREMVAGDAAEVSELYAGSWKRTYGSLYDEENLQIELDKRFSEEKQRSEAENADIITLVAVDGDRVVGAAHSMMDDRNQAWIERMHILPELHGSGLADDLMRATLAKHSGLQSIALKVLSGNDRAIAFYKKHGFSITEEISADKLVGGVPATIMSRTIPRG
ncbi:MAG: GNAT family N-acetyltransferase [Pseudomonadota bacterium]